MDRWMAHVKAQIMCTLYHYYLLQCLPMVKVSKHFLKEQPSFALFIC